MEFRKWAWLPGPGRLVVSAREREFASMIRVVILSQMRLMKRARALSRLLARIGYNVHIHQPAAHDIPEPVELSAAVTGRRPCLLIVLMTAPPPTHEPELCVWLRTTFSKGIHESFLEDTVGILLEFDGREWSVFSSGSDGTKKFSRIEWFIFQIERHIGTHLGLKGVIDGGSPQPAPPPIQLNESGLLLWSIPNQMHVGVRERVEIRIAGTSAEAQLRDGLKGRGLPNIANIEISSLMRSLASCL